MDQHSPNYTVSEGSDILEDAYKVANVRYALNETFNSFKANRKTESRMDHVFVRSSFTVKRRGVLTDTCRSEIDDAKSEKSENFPKEVSLNTYIARLPSDHFPVKAVLSFDE